MLHPIYSSLRSFLHILHSNSKSLRFSSTVRIFFQRIFCKLLLHPINIVDILILTRWMNVSDIIFDIVCSQKCLPTSRFCWMLINKPLLNNYKRKAVPQLQRKIYVDTSLLVEYIWYYIQLFVFNIPFSVYYVIEITDIG